jgi:hypothetical protein
MNTLTENAVVQENTATQQATQQPDKDNSPFGKTFSIFVILFAITIGIALWLLPETSGAAFKDSAAILAFITGAAVAIERIIELLWTYAGGHLGAFWPLKYMNSQADAMKAQLTLSLQPVYKAINGITTITAESKKLFSEMNTEFEELKKRAIDVQRIRLLTTGVRNHLSLLNQADVISGKRVEQISASLSAMENFAAEFKDNPGRRMISLFLGVILGVLVAGFFGLDIFQAVLEGTPPHPRTQIILTGVIIGLGSSPTHEVIRALQEYKKNRKIVTAAKTPEE